MALTKTDSLVTALLAAQQEFPPIHKDSRANTGTYSYTYASLPDLLTTLLPVLQKHGLLLTQKPVEHLGDVWLQTTLRHVSGETDEGLVPLPTPVDWQKWGSSVTYARRYSLTAMLGIAPDDDDDAATAQGFTQRAPAARAPGSYNSPTPGSSGDVCPEHKLRWSKTSRGTNAHPIKNDAGTLLGWCDQAKWEVDNAMDAVKELAWNDEETDR
ncbi:MAG: ERF family protein [Chloroflexi bacterium]|nr:ERF family protein [Chloroflexota bacterium]